MSTKGLPVVAWRTRYRSEPGMIGHYPWTYTERAARTQRAEIEWEPLTDHAAAEAAIAAAYQAGLEAGAAKDKADAERYRWLRANAQGEEGMDGKFRLRRYGTVAFDWIKYEWRDGKPHEVLSCDAAIDAAMKKEHP